MPISAAPELLGDQAREDPDNLSGPCCEGKAFDTACYREQPRGRGERIADCIDEPNGITAAACAIPLKDRLTSSDGMEVTAASRMSAVGSSTV